jgi:hypothetical protein
MANNPDHAAPDPAGATMTVNLGPSHLELPVTTNDERR